MAPKSPLPTVVIGGGVSGMTVAVEAAESGAEVLLVESEPVLGGRAILHHQYFPKLNSPSSGLEMHLRRIKANSRIKVLTNTEAVSIEGARGDFAVGLTEKPRFVGDNCSSCDKGAEVCPVEIVDKFNYSMAKKKAIYRQERGFGGVQYLIDGDACLGPECGKCLEACEAHAINLTERPRHISIHAACVVLATGWEPYDAARIPNLGFGRVPDVINNVMMERLVAPDGPTRGKLLRPSDGMEAKRIAFVQCAGSRDLEHLPYCSSICCMVSLKQALYVREAYPDSQITVIYTQLTNPCPGRYDKFLAKVIDDERIAFLKGRVRMVSENEGGKGVLLDVKETPDSAAETDKRLVADMAVLATGIVPAILSNVLKEVMVLDKHGFMDPEFQKEGIYVTGMAKMPFDITSSMLDATGTALRTIQNIRQ